LVDNKNYRCSQCSKEKEVINYCACYVCGLMNECPKCKKRKISVAKTTRHLIPKNLIDADNLKCSKCGKKDVEILSISNNYPYNYCCEECLFSGKTENCVCDFGGKGERKCTVCGDTFEFKSLCDECFKSFKNEETQEKLKTQGVMDFIRANFG